MNEKKGFRLLEHTADAYIEANGKDLTEAFENAALAMFDVMTDVEKVETEVEDYIEVVGEDESALLYSWLEELLVKFDIDQILYSKFAVLTIEEISDGLKLEAKIWGEKFDADKHRQKVGVKAVTYHLMEILKKPHKTVLRFILDI